MNYKFYMYSTKGLRVIYGKVVEVGEGYIDYTDSHGKGRLFTEYLYKWKLDLRLV